MVRLTIKGHTHLDQLGPRLSESAQIFVAMWFSDSTRQLFDEVISPAVLAAGYTPVRIDDTEHNGKIDDQIIAEIRKSKSVIVDVTCGTYLSDPDNPETKSGVPRGGVYYEAGFAVGLNIPVIWMVEHSLAEVENVVHFDVRQFNQIRWEAGNLDVARASLENRIKATLGQGPNAVPG